MITIYLTSKEESIIDQIINMTSFLKSNVEFFKEDNFQYETDHHSFFVKESNDDEFKINLVKNLVISLKKREN